MPIRRINFLTVALAIAIATAGLCLAWAPRAHADISAPVTVNLDTFENAKDGAAGPVSTPDVLTAGRFYGIEVSGTFTTYLNKIWQRNNAHFGICGTALGSLSGPVFPSPGGATGTPAGQDAEVIFSRPWFLPCPHPLPKQYGAFKVDLGSGFAHPAANNMPSATPHADHTYVYLVQGQGAVARFEQFDTQTRDNSGILQITVRPATASDCNGNSQCLGSAVAPSTTSQPNLIATSASPGKSCVSRRKFTIHVVTHRKDPVVKATLLLSGKRLKVTRKRVHGILRFSSVVDLRKLKRSRFTVTITARTKKGRVLAGKRKYLTCSGKKKGGKPPL